MWRFTGAVGLVVSLAVTTACDTVHPVMIATPRRATIDVSRFNSVLVAGFATARGDPIDTNGEMVRLLRSQLRSKSGLHVIEADAPPVSPRMMADVGYWKRLGAEHRGPLIVTGAVTFTSVIEREPIRTAGTVSFNAMLHDRSRFILEPAFVFIDGATGATLYSHTFREEILYGVDRNVPALSAFFDLIDRLLPGFLHLVTDQVFPGERMLLK
jgi:hypothetical protein